MSNPPCLASYKDSKLLWGSVDTDISSKEIKFGHLSQMLNDENLRESLKYYAPHRLFCSGS